jgi:hypothetical protein
VSARTWGGGSVKYSYNSPFFVTHSHTPHAPIFSDHHHPPHTSHTALHSLLAPARSKISKGGFSWSRGVPIFTIIINLRTQQKLRQTQVPRVSSVFRCLCTPSELRPLASLTPCRQFSAQCWVFPAEIEPRQETCQR